jgi:NAD(P)-dependent dehydrogenase (short-subunit alcohol dehydrogenase family)
MNILITGGASGLGESITRLLAHNKHIIYFTYSASRQNAENLEKEFSNVTAIKCDFKNENDLQSLNEKIPALNIDVLINNAYSGDYLKSQFHKIKTADFLEDFKNNIIPTVSITQTCLELFRKKKVGKIITIITAALINQPPVGAAVYVANKAYLAQLSKTWASENARFNITSNTVSPAFMKTNIHANMDERIVEQIIDGHPLKKLLTTEEVAETVLFLVNASPHINCVDFVLNAGTNLK